MTQGSSDVPTFASVHLGGPSYRWLVVGELRRCGVPATERPHPLRRRPSGDALDHGEVLITSAGGMPGTPPAVGCRPCADRPWRISRHLSKRPRR